MTPFVPVCRLDDLLPERGAAALVDGVQVALFRLHDDTLHALDHRDPFSGANVMARGIVGTRGETPVVASPMYKQVFDLRTGRCLDDDGVALTVHAVRVSDGVVEVALALPDTALPDTALPDTAVPDTAVPETAGAGT